MLTGRGNNVGIYIQAGSGNRIGGILAGEPNLISGNSVDGIQIDGAALNLVQGNIIGLNVNGTAALGNGSQGIAIFNGSATNTIGGTALAARNVISGNGNIGVTISVAGSTGNRIEGNFIGTNAAGTAGIGNFRGVDIGASASGNFIGGTGGAANRIAYNTNSGVTLVAAAGTGNLISANEIFSNGTGLGIDLGDNAVTLNDPGDGDVGANNTQNFPVLSAAMTNGAGSANFAGSLNSAASTTYRIEFFASTAMDPSGFGEGARYLDFTDVTTNPAGHAVIGVTLPTGLTAGEFVTATATDPANNTSEFSGAVVAVGSLVVTTTANTVDGTTTSVSNLIAAPGADGRISLHEAILAANATGGTDTIRFGIPLSDAGHRYYQNDSVPGSLSVVAATALPEANITDFDPDYPAGFTRSWYRIQPAAALPTISDSFVLDGATQPGALVEGPVIELDGASGSTTTLDLQAGSSGSTIRGLVINRAPPPSGNAILVRSSNNVIAGNYLGTNVAGTAAGPGNGVGVRISGGAGAANDNRVGGTTPADRNVLSGNALDGVMISGGSGGAANNVVQGNYIGVDPSGTLDVGNTNQGIAVFHAAGGSNTNNVIGGTAPSAGNVISGNGGDGIGIADVGTTGTLVQGNKIGTNVAGTAGIPNTGAGVRINLSTSNNTVGGTAASARNLIAYNGGAGVLLRTNAGIGNSILGNAILSNGALGIDLNEDGVTGNDALDADGGPNDLLNFPFATAALDSAGVLTAYFKLDAPAGSYRVEFFKNPSGADPSGNGEGETFASAVNVTHPGGGSQNFNHSFAGAAGEILTTTTTLCTDGPACTAFGSTSEFSNAITAVPTAVELISFDAVPRDGAVDLSWRTGSELDNLGFHLYRSLSAAGPYDRITDAVIPGLGSSPMGASYGYTDSGLTNGVPYFYKLEDIETTGRTALHGPVSAVPEDRGEEESRTTYGDPSDVSFRVLERSPRGLLLELVTGGFFGIPQPDGTSRLEVPGFDDLGSEGAPALPVKRTWLEVVAGRRVSIANVHVFEETSLPGLRPSNAGTPSVVASPEGTVRAGLRRARHSVRSTDVVPASAARLVETGFQGDVKKGLVELAPLRWDGVSGRLLWARRLQVRLAFVGVESSERAGRRHREDKSHQSRAVLARLTTAKRGLYRVVLEDVLDSRRRPIASASLRLSHRGEPVAFHVESKALYFMSEGDSVYELESAPGGRMMPVLDAAPSGPLLKSYQRRVEWEENRYYQAGLLDAPSLWLWDVVVSPGSKRYPFTLSAILPEEAKLEVYLQGASDFEAALDHRVRVSVNGIPVGESVWDGKAARTLEALLAPGVLREGGNEISIENAGSAGAPYSMVFLDRFAVTYGRRVVAEGGVLEGSFDESGAVTVEGLSRGSLVVQTSPETVWLRGAEGASFHVEAGRSYLAVSPESVLEAKVRAATASGLRNSRNRADYLLVGPREFLSAAEPLLRHRRSQGLVAKAVAIEEVFDEFGFGESSPEALKEFLEYAYHHWSASPRYVVLLGDATYDRKDYLQTGVRDRVPALMLKTSYLWTASDPLYAAVNGEDGLPDLALGRLPAATVDEARVLVEKVLEYEESGQELSGPAVFVADNPDAAGNFEADSDEIAAGLAGSEVQKIYLRELGAVETRRAIVDSLDRGASLMSYAGHGGIALWASENVFEGSDVESLSPQARQPIVMTMNCLNGYFHFPYFDALGEALVKVKQKGAIAAFSPSGLSLDAPAHLYHQALVAELTSGRHTRLGDAVLAAQRTYAESGLFPELLAIYHLLGDPALQLR
jgi:hypothetical protein